MDFLNSIKRSKNLIDEEIAGTRENVCSTISQPFLKKLYEDLFDSILAGGKRLRPLLVIETYNYFGGHLGKDSEGDIFKAALSVEFLHNSTLIHDDIVDEDDVRRGHPSFHKSFQDAYLKKKDDSPRTVFSTHSRRFGSSMALFGGNMLYAMGLGLLSDSGFDQARVKSVCRLYADAYCQVNEGQIVDVLAEGTIPSETQYIGICRRKTAALFESCVGIGAALAGVGGEQVKLLTTYARHVAIAFQLSDDVLDVTGGKGNTFGSDIRQGKKTLLVIKALELCDELRREKLLDVLGNAEASDKDVEVVHNILRETSLSYVRQLCELYVSSGMRELEKLDHNRDDSFFISLAEFVSERIKE